MVVVVSLHEIQAKREGLLPGAKGGAQDAKGGGGGEKPPNPANEATALMPNKV